MTFLTPAEIDFILEKLQLGPILRARLKHISASGGSIGEDDADFLRDRCGERLQVYGFGSKYEPTTEGRLLEDLIDKLFVG